MSSHCDWSCLTRLSPRKAILQNEATIFERSIPEYVLKLAFLYISTDFFCYKHHANYFLTRISGYEGYVTSGLVIYMWCDSHIFSIKCIRHFKSSESGSDNNQLIANPDFALFLSARKTDSRRKRRWRIEESCGSKVRGVDGARWANSFILGARSHRKPPEEHTPSTASLIVTPAILCIFPLV